MLVDRVRFLLKGLSNQRGKAWASERKKCGMIEKTFGRRPGDRSVYRIEKQMERAGEIRRTRVYPGGRLPDGSRTTRGRVVVTLISRQQQRSARRVARKLAASSPKDPIPTHGPTPGSPVTHLPNPPRPVKPKPLEERPATPEEVARILREGKMDWVLGKKPPGDPTAR